MAGTTADALTEVAPALCCDWINHGSCTADLKMEGGSFTSDIFADMTAPTPSCVVTSNGCDDWSEPTTSFNYPSGNYDSRDGRVPSSCSCACRGARN